MCPSASASRHRARGFALAAACCALLGGCGNPTPPGPPMASSPSGGATHSREGSPDPARWGAYGTRERACSAVTDDVVALSLLPTSLAVSHHREDVRRVEDRVQGVVEAAPPPLRRHFARVRDLVGSYADALPDGGAASPAPTESSPPTASPGPTASASAPEFDARALDDSLEPVRQWLRTSCSDVAPPG